MNNHLSLNHLVLNIGLDEDAGCPSDFEPWRLVSFNHRHGCYEHPDNFFPDGALPLGLRRKLEVGTAFILSCCEHGGIQWGLRGETWQCPWDTKDVAGLLLCTERRDIPGSKDGRERDARQFLDTYNDWANGYVLWFSLEDDGGETLDSCGDIYGGEHLMADFVRPAIAAYMEEHGFDTCEVLGRWDEYDEGDHDDPGVLYLSAEGEARDQAYYYDPRPESKKPGQAAPGRPGQPAAA